ncbi:hypothetical protein Rsub_04577 [Raphidocelis subcapitata]|uniref:MSP domain-containing protein n=1 Tax=Raphidocelis subcapitata TaxID=307507 RepID=A0A2V0P3P3_9CHLO|nr:hypothetical protein Rsub_04577 [Raphidocelis subcapitata]|eukprot:GBF92473.1 hypothetical protein Rsub_04577 [Raphidocelis subcapitata]
MADSVSITPAELKFRFQINKQLPASITIHNPTGDRVAFKVKTTTPKKYVVRPSAGIVDPRTTANVQVIMQAQKEYPADMAHCKDKFLVQTEVLQAGEDIGSETFKKAEGTKLRVLIEGPPAPPSPVPEVNETEDESAKSEKPDSAAAATSTGFRSAAGAGDEATAAENRALRKQLEQIRDERDAYKRQLDVRARAGPAAVKPSSSLPIVAIILAAVLAFLVGHYLEHIQKLAGVKV